MLPIIKPKEMFELDSYLINNVGIPSLLLMENAASQSASYINNILPSNSKILIICGTGNNGGDGLALFRHLCNNYNVEYTIVGNKNKLSKENEINFTILNRMVFSEITDNIDFNNYDCIIDSILGIGLKLPLKLELSELIKKINLSSAIKIAIDLPTGLDPLTGIADTNTFNADYTLTMYAEKTGLLLNDGKDYSGIIKSFELGIPKNIFFQHSNIRKYTQYKQLVRANNTSKFDYGKCLIIAGSENMPGAAELTANACISSGAGLVYLCTTSISNNIFSEIITYKVDEYSIDIFKESSLEELLNKCDSIVIGPGLGKSKIKSDLINYIIENYNSKNIILDADAITTLDYNKKYYSNITITPHIGEFSDLLSIDRKLIESKLPDIVQETAKKMNLNILLKGSTTIISDGEDLLFVAGGVPEMATAGSGDVLSGIIGAQINQNICGNSLQNIANACLLHIEATKYSLKDKYNIIASDIIEGIRCIK